MCNYCELVMGEQTCVTNCDLVMGNCSWVTSYGQLRGMGSAISDNVGGIFGQNCLWRSAAIPYGCAMLKQKEML